MVDDSDFGLVTLAWYHLSCQVSLTSFPTKIRKSNEAKKRSGGHLGIFETALRFDF